MESPALPDFTASLCTFLRIPESAIHLNFSSYRRDHYDPIWARFFQRTINSRPEAGYTHSHVHVTVDTISQLILEDLPCRRGNIRDRLTKKPLFLDLRLWLVIGIIDQPTHSPPVYCDRWNDRIPLNAFVAEQFQEPQLTGEGARYALLPRDFNLVNLSKQRGLKVIWVTDLSYHLQLDPTTKKLYVFPLNHYVSKLRESKVEIIPNAAIDEYKRTLEVLFPGFDFPSQKFLRKSYPSLTYKWPNTHNDLHSLSDFRYWRDRIYILYDLFLTPRPSVIQQIIDTDRRPGLQAVPPAPIATSLWLYRFSSSTLAFTIRSQEDADEDKDETLSIETTSSASVLNAIEGLPYQPVESTVGLSTITE